jgi:c-di-GMP-binding flagellar brake protein YcgR
MDTSWLREVEEQQRWRTDRIQVDWDARYRFPGGLSWYRCHVVDISLDGAGLVLVDDTALPLHSLVVDLQLPNNPDRIALRGAVRHSSVTTEGRRRIGIQFVDIGPFEEHSLAELIAYRRDRQRGR